MGLNTIQILDSYLHEHVVECKPTDKHANLAPFPHLGNFSRILHRFPANLQQHALLRVHQRCLTWRNSKEFAIKPVNIFNLTCPSCRAFSDHAPGWVIELLHRPPIG